jgi:hypothetical protein
MVDWIMDIDEVKMIRMLFVGVPGSSSLVPIMLRMGKAYTPICRKIEIS